MFKQYLIKISLFIFFSLGLVLLALPVKAGCKGCLCPSNPCNLCPLPPAMQNNSLKLDESDLCAIIRKKVPPTSAEPGSNEYFPSLDSSIMACMKGGGDVVRNKDRNAEFPSRFYCKPPR